MHIIAMLTLVILGLSLFEYSMLLGGPLVIAGLFCFTLGSARWRQEQESLIFAISLLCGAGILIINFGNWLLT